MWPNFRPSWLDNLHNPPYLNICGKHGVRSSNTFDVAGNLEKVRKRPSSYQISMTPPVSVWVVACQAPSANNLPNLEAIVLEGKYLNMQSSLGTQRTVLPTYKQHKFLL